MTSISLVVDYFNVIVFSISLIICLFVLLLSFIRINSIRSKVTILLICNNYISTAFVIAMMLIMDTYNLYGSLHPTVLFDDYWCHLRTYFIFIGYCNFYYSFALQAIFRLFRIVFYQRKNLRGRRVFHLALIIQWILCLLLPLPNYLPNDYEYLPDQYKCWFSFENSRGLLLALLFVYSIPLSIIISIYIYILRYLRRRNFVQRRQESNRRDILILKRIVILLLFTVAVGLPTAIILFIYMIGHYLIPYSYDIQSVGLSISLFASSICLFLITPELKEIIRFRQRRTHPVVFLQNTVVGPMSSNRGKF